MASTFKNMIDDTKDFCQELQGLTDFTDTRVKRVINRGYRAFVKATGGIVDVLDITTVANQVFYTSSDVANFAYMWRIVWVKHVDDTTNDNGQTLFPYPGGEAQLPESKQFGEPTHYYLRGMSTPSQRKIGFHPIPDANSETIRVQVVRGVATELSANGDTPDIDERYREALTFYAVWQLHHAYSHKNPVWRAKAIEFKTLYDEVITQFKLDNFDPNISGEVVTDVYAPY